MISVNDIPLRSGRDRMLHLLFHQLPPASEQERDETSNEQQILPFPLRDLPIAARRKVSRNDSADIFVIGAQQGVNYILCDDKGIPILRDGSEIVGELIELASIQEEVLDDLRALTVQAPGISQALEIPAAGDVAGIEDFTQAWRRVVLFKTPNIDEDSTFRILARKAIQSHVSVALDHLEVYLHQSISIRVGIDTSLTVRFLARRGTDVIEDNGHQIRIDFNQPILHNQPLHIQILQSQEGIRYEIWEKESRTVRSAHVVGGSQGGDGSIVLETRDPFEEDIVLVVRAFRDPGNPNSTDLLEAGDLDDPLTVFVRPNPALIPVLNGSEGVNILPFSASPTVLVNSAQETVNYDLFHYPLKQSYTFEADGAEYSKEGLLNESVRDALFDPTLQPIPVLVGRLFQTEPIEFPLTQDSVLMIRATKKVNGDSLFLTQHLLALIEPDPQARLVLDPPFASQGEVVQIAIHEAQSRVAYQLQEFVFGNPEDRGPAFIFGADKGIGWISNGRAVGMRLLKDSPIFGDLRVRGNSEDAEGMFPGASLELEPQITQGDVRARVLAFQEYSGASIPLPQEIRLRSGFLSFNGTSDEVMVNGFAGIGGNSPRTVEAWIQASQANRPFLSYGSRTGSGTRWVMRIGQTGSLQLGIGGRNLQGTLPLSDGKWHHVCAVFDPNIAGNTLNSISLFVDGVLEIKGSSNHQIQTGLDEPFRIGKGIGGGLFEGLMAEVRIWDRALSLDEIRQGMFSRLIGSEANLQGNWRLDEQGPSFADRSSNGNEALLVAAGPSSGIDLPVG